MHYIWWLSQGEMEALGKNLPAGFPTRIVKGYASLWGRAGRGRLWGGDGQSVPEDLFSSMLGRWLSRCGGIVVSDRDFDVLRRAPGTVTDFELRRVSCTKS